MSWFSNQGSSPSIPTSNSVKQIPARELTIGNFDEKREAETSSSSAPILTSQSKPISSISNLITVRARKRTKGKTMEGDATLFSLEKPFFPKLSSGDSVYKFTQYINIGTSTASTTISTSSAYNFSLNQVDQVSQLTAVFDQYRIDEIEFWLWPKLGAEVASATADQGILASVIDYDDSNLLGSLTAALDYVNVLVSSGRDGHYRRFKPHVAIAAYSGSFSSFANETSPWLDAASPSVQHYGVKTVWTACDAAYSQSIQARLHLSFRNIR